MELFSVALYTHYTLFCTNIQLSYTYNCHGHSIVIVVVISQSKGIALWPALNQLSLSNILIGNKSATSAVWCSWAGGPLSTTPTLAI